MADQGEDIAGLPFFHWLAIASVGLLLPFLLPAAEECGGASNCRPLSADECRQVSDLLSSFQALLPVPDPSRFQELPRDATAAGDDALAQLFEQGQTCLTCLTYANGCFPPDLQVRNVYATKHPDSEDDAALDLVSWMRKVLDESPNELEIVGRILPAPFPLEALASGCIEPPASDSRVLKKTPNLLAYESGAEECLEWHLIFGPRSCRPDEYAVRDTPPPPQLAPIVSGEVIIRGTAAEVHSLCSRVDTRALLALLQKPGR